MKSFPEHLTSPQRPLYVPASGMTGQANDPDMVTMRPGAADPPLLQARGIQKRYEAVVALGNGSLEVRAGEVMGLVGDNGAGKSTLVKCLSGVVTPDAGEILFEGQPIPEVLISGDHAKIAVWRREQAENLTKLRRPDLWAARKR